MDHTTCAAAWSHMALGHPLVSITTNEAWAWINQQEPHAIADVFLSDAYPHLSIDRLYHLAFASMCRHARSWRAVWHCVGGPSPTAKDILVTSRITACVMQGMLKRLDNHEAWYHLAVQHTPSESDFGLGEWLGRVIEHEPRLGLELLVRRYREFGNAGHGAWGTWLQEMASASTNSPVKPPHATAVMSAAMHTIMAEYEPCDPDPMLPLDMEARALLERVSKRIMSSSWTSPTPA